MLRVGHCEARSVSSCVQIDRHAICNRRFHSHLCEIVYAFSGLIFVVCFRCKFPAEGIYTTSCWTDWSPGLCVLILSSIVLPLPLPPGLCKRPSAFPVFFSCYAEDILLRLLVPSPLTPDSLVSFANLFLSTLVWVVDTYFEHVFASLCSCEIHFSCYTLIHCIVEGL